MRRKIWYYYMWVHLNVGFVFFYKKFKVVGRKNVPRKRPVLYLPNHQNTFLDALLVAVSQLRMTHYMARADVFTSPKLTWLMSTVNLRPIYRIRDGKKAVAKNEQVFDELIDFMNDGECVMIHPEGSHSLKYKVRQLHKGFIRLAFGFLEKYPNQELDIIPIGLNYDNHTDYRSGASIHFGKPIDARSYFEKEDRHHATTELLEEVRLEIKKMVTHIVPDELYDEKFEQLQAAGADFTEPEDTRAKLLKLESDGELPVAKPRKANIFEKILYPIVFLNNILMVLIWKKIKPVFKDIAWYGSIKYVLGTFVAPIIYGLQTLVVYLLFGPVWALLYLFFTIITTPILRLGQAHTSY